MQIKDPVNGTLAVRPDGTFSYQHDDSETTTDQFSYVIEDQGGNTHTVTIDVQVLPVNDHAPFIANGALQVNEGNSSSSLLSGSINLLEGTIDTDAGDSIHVVDVNDPEYGILTVQANGTFSYQHDGSETITDQFSYVIEDNGGNTHTVTVDVQILPVNDHTPFIADSTLFVFEGDSAGTLQSGASNLLQGLVDMDADDTIRIVQVNNPQHGTLNVQADGTFGYQHDGSETTTDQFSYVIEDDGGNTHTITVDVQIQAINDHSPVIADGTLLVSEGDNRNTLQSGISNLLDGVIDADAGDSIQIVQINNPQNGSLTVQTNGTFDYQHDDSETTTDQFSYVIEDNGGNTHTVNVEIQIQPVNDHAPYIADGALLVDEGGSRGTLQSGIGNLLAGTIDADAEDSIIIVQVNDPANGILTVQANGTFSYQHDGSETTTDQFSYVIEDEGGNTHTVTIDVQIQPINDHTPFIDNGSLQIDEGGSTSALQSGTTNLLDGVIDPDAGDSIRIVQTNDPENGTLIVQTNGTFNYQHDGTETTTDQFSYVIEDDGGNSHTVTVDIQIQPVNDHVPFIADGTMLVDEGSNSSTLQSGISNLLAGVIDADADDSISIVQINDPENGTLTIQANGTFDYQHDGSETTTDQFSYVIEDDGGNTHTITIGVQIQPVNDHAPFIADGILRVDEGVSSATLESGIGNLLAGVVDGDASDSIRIIAVNDPQNGTLNVHADGSFNYQHDGSETTADQFSYVIEDDGGNIHTITIDIQIQPVNDHTPFIADGILWVDEGGSSATLDSGISNLLAGIVDGDAGDSIRIVQVSDPAYGTLVVQPDGTFSYQHDGSETTTDQFSYIIEDNGGNTHTVTAEVQIQPVNDHGPFIGDGTLLVDEGGSSATLQSGINNLLAGVVDEDAGDSIRIIQTSDPANGTLIVEPDGTFSYQHDGSETTTDQFSYIIEDDGGKSHTVTVDIQIQSVNDHTPFIADGTLLVDEGGSSAALESGISNFLAGVVDGDTGDSIRIIAVNDPQNGTLKVQADGTFDYQHDGSETTTDQFSYVIEDNGGNTHTVTIDVQIHPVNDHTPFIADGTLLVDEGGSSVTLRSGISNLLAGVVDQDSGDSIRITQTNDPANGTLIVEADGTFSYQHDGSETATDQFSYVIEDNGGNTHTVTIDVQIQPVNDHVPFIADATLLVNEGDSSATLQSGSNNLLAGVVDEDNGDSIRIVQINDPAVGTLTVQANGAFSYQHDGSETTIDQFSYVIEDDGGNTHTVTIDVQINPVNDHAPFIADAMILVEEGGTSATLESGISNLLAGVVDEDNGDSIRIVEINDPVNGTLLVQANGTFSYQHNDTETTTDRFSYVIEDNGGNRHTVTVDAFISSVNDHAPFVPDDTVSVPEGGSIGQLDSGRTGLLENLTDADTNDTATITVVSQPINGSLTIDSGNTFSYTHDNSETTMDSFVYRVTDSGGNSHDVTVMVAVDPVNDNAPVLSPQRVVVVEGGQSSSTDAGHLSLLQIATDTDPDDTPSLIEVSQPAHGTITWAVDGTFSYLHDGSENHSDLFTITVNDRAGNSSNSEIEVTVLPSNDPPIGQNSEVTMPEDGVYVFSVDDFAYTDPAEQHDLHAVIVTAQPTNGTLLLSGNLIADGQTIDTDQLNDSALIYQPTANLYGTAADSLEFLIVDAGGIANGGSDTALSPNTLSIHIDAVNDAPVLTGTLPDITLRENTVVTSPIPSSLFADIDDSALTFEMILADNNTLPDWLNFSRNDDDILLIASPSADQIGTTDLKLQATDSHGQNATLLFSVTVVDVNDAPTAILPDTAGIDENQTGANVTTLFVVDPDPWDRSIVTVDDPRFEISDGILKLRDGESLNHENEPQVQLALTARDTGGNELHSLLIVNVHDINEAPVADNDNLSAFELSKPNFTPPYSVEIPTDLFRDPDGDPLTVTASLADGSALPAWIEYDPVTLTLTLTKDAPVGTTPAIRLIATDPSGSLVFNDLTLQVEPILAAAVAIGPDSPKDAAAPIFEERNIDNNTVQQPQDTTGESSESSSTQERQTTENAPFSEPLALPDIVTTPTNQRGDTAITVQESSTYAARRLMKNDDFKDAVYQSTFATPLVQLLADPQVQDDAGLEQLLSGSMDNSRETLEEQQASIKQVIASTVTISSGFSIAYVMWLVRGGALAASVLTGLPAWRNIDPLPVLGTLEGPDDNVGDNETLETMVTSSGAQDPDKPHPD